MLQKNKKNNKLTWINFLHLYQPVNVDGHLIKEATEMSYLRLIRGLEEHPNIKFTLNITGCLFLRWEELNYFDLIKRLKNLVKKGQIELVSSAAYHPLLPLIPEKEARKQIKENESILKKYFGKNFKAKGFFLPEMAYSKKIAKLIKKLGYQWIILDEIAYNGKLKQVDYSQVYQDKASGLKIVFRNRQLSKSYVPQTILDLIKKQNYCNPVITATDGELYGLRHNDPTAEFEKLLSSKNLETLTVSKFISSKKAIKELNTIPSSWETTTEELKAGKPYILWYDKENDIQMRIWQFANLVYRTIEEYRNDVNHSWARWHLVRGLASCSFWWASAKDFRLFGPISWSPDEIERGINELIRAIRALDNSNTRRIKIKAEKLYIKIKQMVWQKHWTYYWKR
ncbi:MAG: polysaccharide deacetylase family protein [Patescibacteria group bacterium]